MAISTISQSWNAGTGGFSLSWPSGHQADDIAILGVETANQAVTAPTGFAEIGNIGTGTTTTGTRITLFWRRATSSAMGSITLADAGDHMIALCVLYRGCVNTNEPYDTAFGTSGIVLAAKATASTTTTWAAATSTNSTSWPIWWAVNPFDYSISGSLQWTSASNTVFGNVGASGVGSHFNNAGNGGQIISLFCEGGSAGLSPLASGASTGTTTAALASSLVDCVATICLIESRVTNVNGTDTAAGSESATGNISGTRTDTAAGSEAATGNLAGTRTDTAAGSEAVSSVRVSGATDTATGSETATVTIVASADTGTGTEAATGNLVGVQADTATGTESATGNLAGVRTDTGTGSEAVNLVNLTGVGDTATGVEGQSVNQGGNTFLVSDDATVSDAGRISTAVGDTGTAADSAFATNLVVGTDTATGSESAALRVATPADTGTGTEAATGKLAGTQADTATGTDAASVRQSVSDTSTGADVGSVGISPADTATVSESATVTIIVIKEVTDTAVATEAITKLSVLAAEISVADENGFVAGLLLGGDRVKGVGAEDRTFYVQAESRTLAVEPRLQPAVYITDEPERVVEIENENRLKMIGREDRTLTIYAPVREEVVV